MSSIRISPAKVTGLLRALIVLLSGFFCLTAQAQPDRWQQRVSYEMKIDFDVNSHQFTGTQRLIYLNNSPDTLDRVFYHLYFNAFQPNSMMDVRSRTIPDPDGRVGSRISKLQPDEIGYEHIHSLKQNGTEVHFTDENTVLEVTLAEPIMPQSSTVLEMEFSGQVPVQIRRSGRDNAEGIAYSMAQWYPKMCEYDYQGWHADPYIAREFYGVWGDYDVTIRIDSAYTIGGTGYLQNPCDIGHGYCINPARKVEHGKLTWHFLAPNVHDFMWAADPEYQHLTHKAADGTELHFFYQENDRTKESWPQLASIMDSVFSYADRNFGKYPYKQYAFVQGGDGGMEYPMATLITGDRSIGSLVGVATHELMHSWYQMILGTNESLVAWMDEGYTSYASTRIMDYLVRHQIIAGTPNDNPFQRVYAGYTRFTKSGAEEPLSTHADHFQTNSAYGMGSYTKGQIFLNQLEYVIGKPAFDRGILRYFNTWKFKHPNANDFIRIMEKESGLELDWYKEYMVNTTHTIDYAIESVIPDGDSTMIALRRIGLMPMPQDLVVRKKDGTVSAYNIPLTMMRGEKQELLDGQKFTKLPDWPWTHPEYQFKIPVKEQDIEQVELDPSHRMADIDLTNNVYPTH